MNVCKGSLAASRELVFSSLQPCERLVISNANDWSASVRITGEVQGHFPICTLHLLLNSRGPHFPSLLRSSTEIGFHPHIKDGDPHVPS